MPDDDDEEKGPLNSLKSIFQGVVHSIYSVFGVVRGMFSSSGTPTLALEPPDESKGHLISAAEDSTLSVGILNPENVGLFILCIKASSCDQHTLYW